MNLICKFCKFSTEHSVDWIDDTPECFVTTQCLSCFARGSAAVAPRVARLRSSATAASVGGIEVLSAIKKASSRAKIT